MAMLQGKLEFNMFSWIRACNVLLRYESTRIQYSGMIIKHVNCVTCLHFRHLFEFRVLPSATKSMWPYHTVFYTLTILTLVCRVWASLDCSSRSWVSLWRKLSGDEMRYFTAEEMCLEGGVFLWELLFLFHAIPDSVIDTAWLWDVSDRPSSHSNPPAPPQIPPHHTTMRKTYGEPQF